MNYSVIQKQNLDVTRNNILFYEFKEGNPNAFQYIYNQHKDNVRRLILSRINKPCDAEDLMQNIFMKIWECRSDLDINKSPLGLLYRMTLNVVNNYKKHEDVVKRYNLYMNYYRKSSIINSDSDLFFNEVRSKFETTLFELPPSQKEISILFWNKGMSTRQIAKQRGLSIRTVDNQIYRTRKRFKEELKRFLE